MKSVGLKDLKKVIDGLELAFAWEESKEGYEYWCEVSDKLYAIYEAHEGATD